MDRRMRAAGATMSWVQDRGGPVENTLRKIGRQDTKDRTLRLLVDVLGFELDELRRARSEDRGHLAAEWPATVSLIAITASHLDPDDQELLLSVADAIAVRSAKRADHLS